MSDIFAAEIKID